MKPEYWIESAACGSAHVAESPSSPVVQGVVNVFEGRHFCCRSTTADIGLLGGERRVRCDEQNAVEPVFDFSSKISSSFPFPGLKFIFDAFVVDNTLGILIVKVCNVFFGPFDIWVAASPFRAVVLSLVNDHFSPNGSSLMGEEVLHREVKSPQFVHLADIIGAPLLK